MPITPSQAATTLEQTVIDVFEAYALHVNGSLLGSHKNILTNNQTLQITSLNEQGEEQTEPLSALYALFLSLLSKSSALNKAPLEERTVAIKELHLLLKQLFGQTTALLGRDPEGAKPLLLSPAGLCLFCFLLDNVKDPTQSIETFINNNKTLCSPEFQRFFDFLYEISPSKKADSSISSLPQLHKTLRQDQDSAVAQIKDFLKQDFCFLSSLPSYFQILFKMHLTKLIVEFSYLCREDEQQLANIINELSQSKLSLNAESDNINSTSTSTLLLVSLWSTKIANFHSFFQAFGQCSKPYSKSQQLFYLLTGCLAIPANDEKDDKYLQRSVLSQELMELFTPFALCLESMVTNNDLYARLTEKTRTKILKAVYHRLFLTRYNANDFPYSKLLSQEKALLEGSYLEHLSADELFKLLDVHRVHLLIENKPMSSTEQDGMRKTLMVANFLREFENLLLYRKKPVRLEEELSLLTSEIRPFSEERGKINDFLTKNLRSALLSHACSLLERFSVGGELLIMERANSKDVEALYSGFKDFYRLLDPPKERLSQLKVLLPYQRLSNIELEDAARLFELPKKASQHKPSPVSTSKKKSTSSKKKNSGRRTPSKSSSPDSPSEQNASATSLKSEADRKDSLSPINQSPSSITASFFPPPPAFQTPVSVEAFPSILTSFVRAVNELGFQNLFLIGGALTHFHLHQNFDGVHDFDFLLISAELDFLCGLIQNKHLENIQFKEDAQAKVFGKCHQTLSLVLKEDDGSTISIDINTCPLMANDPIKTVKHYLQHATFKLSAFFMEFNSHDVFFLRYSGGDQVPVSKTTIELMKNDRETFIKIPLALFRLIKLALKYPNLDYDSEVDVAIERFKEASAFEDFFKDKSLPLKTKFGQVNTYLNQLFPRFSTNVLVDKLLSTGLLASLTDINQDELVGLFGLPDNQNYIANARCYEEQSARLYYLLLAYRLYKTPTLTSENCVFYQFANSIRPAFAHNIKHIEKQCTNRATLMVFSLPELDALLPAIEELAQQHLPHPTPLLLGLTNS